MSRTTNAFSFAQKTTQTRIPSASRARLAQRELRSSRSSSAMCTAPRAGNFPRPAVYRKQLVEIRTREQGVALHRSGDAARDLAKRYLTRQILPDRLLIRRAQHRRQRAALF